MTQEQHPITPPPELVQQWCHKWTIANGDFGPYLATQSARWGADQELEACKVYLAGTPYPSWAIDLHSARRPKPPSLKEEALELVDRIEKAKSPWAMSELDTIRRALESLPD